MINFNLYVVTAVLLTTLARASCDSDDFWRERSVIETRSYASEALGSKLVRDLNITGLFDCIAETYSALPMVGYYITDRTVHLNITSEHMNERFFEAMNRCDDADNDGLYVSDYLVYSQNMGWQFSELDNTKTDESEVVSNVLPGAPIQRRQMLSGATVKRATNVQVEFDAGTKQQSVACDSYAYSCINKCSNANGVAMSTSISGITVMAAWSHHYCEFKGRDDQRQTLQVRSKNTRYYIAGGPSFRIYSSAMNNAYVTDNFGNGRSQNWCGEHY